MLGAFSSTGSGATPPKFTTPVTRSFNSVMPPVRWLAPASNRSAPAATSSTWDTAMPTWRLPSRHTTTMICRSASPSALEASIPPASSTRKQRCPSKFYTPAALPDVLDPARRGAVRCGARQPTAPPHSAPRPPPEDTQVSWPSRRPSPLQSHTPALRPYAHGHMRPLFIASIRGPESAPGRRCSSTVAPEYRPMSFQNRGERLHHNLLGIGQPIHHQPETPPVGIQNSDEVIALRGWLVLPCLSISKSIQKHQRQQQLAAQPGKAVRPPSHSMAAAACSGGTWTQFRQRPLRQGKALVQTAHNQGRNDGQRQWNPHPQEWFLV